MPSRHELPMKTHEQWSDTSTKSQHNMRDCSAAQQNEQANPSFKTGFSIPVEYPATLCPPIEKYRDCSADSTTENDLANT